MRILHVLSQTEITGSEVYASQLGFFHERQGHEIFYVSDKLHTPVPGMVVNRPISRRGWANRIRNILFLRQFVRENKIDVVHAHSRAASWICHWALRGKPVAYVSTVHGRQHLHRSSQSYSVYGDRIIAVCEHIKRHLVREMGFETNRIDVIPNGFSAEELGVTPENAVPPTLSLLGRTSGPKGERASDLIETLLAPLMEAHPKLRFEIAGGLLSNLRPQAQAELAGLQAKYPERMHVQAYVTQEEIRRIIRRSSLVVASGRIAIVALAAGVPTLAMGEAACHGLVNEINLHDAIRSNFGDILADRELDVNLNLLARSLREFFRQPHFGSAVIAETIRMRFDLERIGQAVTAVYFESLATRRLPKRIPILMYHKVVKEGFSSPHKTYITEEGFTRHMEALRRFGFETITFADIRAASLGQQKLPAKPVVLTFDDGYMGTHERAVPVLRRLGQRGVFYLLGDRGMAANSWDEPDCESSLISDAQVKELVAAGMEVGAHSMSHRPMSGLSPEEALREARSSKETLEKLTGTELCSYAYPYGDLSEESKEAVRDAGFSYAVATDSGGLSFAQDLFHLFRVNMFPQDGVLQVFKKTHAAYRPYYAWKRGK